MAALFSLLAVACGAPSAGGGDAGVTDSGVVADGEDAGSDPDAGVVEWVPVWSQVTGTPNGGVRWGTVLTFDPVDRRFVLHGGNTYDQSSGTVLADTWSFDLAQGTWSELQTTGAAPPPRYCHCAAFLPNERQVLIIGGRDSSAPVTSAYTLDLDTLEWAQVSGTTPTNAIGCTAAWMPNVEGGRAIVFGGEGLGGLSNDTFSYDPVARTFTELTLPFSPPARRDPMSFYEPVSKRLLVFGGAVSIAQRTHLDDLQNFDGTEWSEYTPLLRPSPRRYGASGYDAIHGRWLLYGGSNELQDFDDVWTYDPSTNQFKEETVTGGPTPRSFTASAVDEVTGELYLFGGFTPSYQGKTDGWKLALQAKQ